MEKSFLDAREGEPLMGTAVVYVLITAIPTFTVYVSMLYILGSPLLAIVPAGICYATAHVGYNLLRGE